MKKPAYTGIVLAGGKSSRMGSDKGLLQYNGKCMVEHALNALKPVVDELFIVANNPAYTRFSYPVYADILPDCGPMGGIFTGLSLSKHSENIILSCDIPHVDSSLISRLLDVNTDAQVRVPRHHEKVEPLCAVYHKSCAETLKQLLHKKELKMKNALSHFRVVYLDLPSDAHTEWIFKNLNFPSDIHPTIELPCK